MLLVLFLGACNAVAQAGKTSAQPKAQVSAKNRATKTPTKSSKKRRKARKPRGQQSIHSARVRQIQEALIQARYLDGEPSGAWDQRTKKAMARFQADNGWQTKVLPDSRALIKLGLGPDQSNLINPDTAVTASAPAGPGHH